MVWRVLAFSGIFARPDGAQPTGAELALAAGLGAMGLAFLVLGLLALARSGSRSSRIFALYGVFAGLHWGGTLVLPPGEAQVAVTLLYVVLSSLLAECLFLHFALTFPDPWRIASRRSAIVTLYFPVPAGALLALGFVLSADWGQAHDVLKTAFSLTYAVQTNLYALLSPVVICVRFARADPFERRRAGLGILALCVAGPTVVYVSAEAAGLSSELVNLLFVLTPIGAAIALVRDARDPRPNPLAPPPRSPLSDAGILDSWRAGTRSLSTRGDDHAPSARHLAAQPGAHGHHRPGPEDGLGPHRRHRDGVRQAALDR